MYGPAMICKVVLELKMAYMKNRNITVQGTMATRGNLISGSLTPLYLDTAPFKISSTHNAGSRLNLSFEHYPLG